MTSNHKTVTLQNLWAGNMALMSEGNRALLPTNVELPWLQQLRFNEFPASKFPGTKIANHLKSQNFPPLRLRKHWDSRETKLTDSLGTSHYVYNISLPSQRSIKFCKKHWDLQRNKSIWWFILHSNSLDVYSFLLVCLQKLCKIHGPSFMILVPCFAF